MTITQTQPTVPMTEAEFDHLADTDMAAWNAAVLHRLAMTDEHKAGHELRSDCWMCVDVDFVTGQ